MKGSGCGSCYVVDYWVALDEIKELKKEIKSLKKKLERKR
jgi:hypothetical protein